MSIDWSFLKEMRDFCFEDAYRQLTANRSIWWSWGPEFVSKLGTARKCKGISCINFDISQIIDRLFYRNHEPFLFLIELFKSFTIVFFERIR